MVGLILLVLLIMLLVGLVPSGPLPIYQHGYGYAPSSIVGVLLIVVLVLLLTGRL